MDLQVRLGPFRPTGTQRVKFNHITHRLPLVRCHLPLIGVPGK